MDIYNNKAQIYHQGEYKLILFGMMYKNIAVQSLCVSVCGVHRRDGRLHAGFNGFSSVCMSPMRMKTLRFQ